VVSGGIGVINIQARETIRQKKRPLVAVKGRSKYNYVAHAHKLLSVYGGIVKLKMWQIVTGQAVLCEFA
jgi:hypothetical protein